ncbi:hypothetical protein D3C87_1942880 [compost metagenome]
MNSRVNVAHEVGRGETAEESSVDTGICSALSSEDQSEVFDGVQSGFAQFLLVCLACNGLYGVLRLDAFLV